MNYKHIIFDIDGTLLDTEHATLHSLQDTIRELQHRTLALSELGFAMFIPDKEALKQLGVSDIGRGMQVWQDHFKLHLSTVSVFKGIRELLEELRKRRYKLGIITSEGRQEYKQGFLHFGLEGFFETVICAEDTVRHKPDPEPMKKYLQATGTSEKEVLFIGDSVYDMQCASDAGVNCGLVLWGRHSVRPIRATYYFNAPGDILNLLNNGTAGLTN